MDLHQFQLTYIAVEDRIMLRVSFRAADHSLQELRAWLTRRMVQRVWPTILEAMQTQVTLDRPSAAHARTEIVNMAHQASLSEMAAAGKFGAPYDAAIDHFPLGQTPIVVTRAEFNMTRDHPLRMHFFADGDRGFEIAFQPDLLHGFCSLLQTVVTQADWGIELAMPIETPAPAEARLLN